MPLLSPENLPDPEFEPTSLTSPALAGTFFAAVSPVSSRGVPVLLFLSVSVPGLVRA